MSLDLSLDNTDSLGFNFTSRVQQPIFARLSLGRVRRDVGDVRSKTSMPLTGARWVRDTGSDARFVWEFRLRRMAAAVGENMVRSSANTAAFSATKFRPAGAWALSHNIQRPQGSYRGAMPFYARSFQAMNWCAVRPGELGPYGETQDRSERRDDLFRSPSEQISLARAAAEYRFPLAGGTGRPPPSLLGCGLLLPALWPHQTKSYWARRRHASRLLESSSAGPCPAPGSRSRLLRRKCFCV